MFIDFDKRKKSDESEQRNVLILFPLFPFNFNEHNDQVFCTTMHDEVDILKGSP